MRLLKRRSILVFLGKTGFGKSYLLDSQVLQHLPKPVFIFDHLGDYYNNTVVYDNLLELAQDVDDGGVYSGIYSFRPINEGDAEALFDIAASVSGCTLVIEEADMFATPYVINETLEALIKRGRHKAITLVFVSRRASELNRLVTSQANAIISFQQTEKIDLDTLKKLGFDIETLKQLKKYNYLIKGDLPSYLAFLESSKYFNN